MFIPKLTLQEREKSSPDVKWVDMIVCNDLSVRCRGDNALAVSALFFPHSMAALNGCSISMVFVGHSYSKNITEMAHMLSGGYLTLTAS